MPKINTVLVANRGEIAIRVFRACNELGIRTVAIYSKEDTLSLHRNKADEAYMVGEGKSPTDAYLDIEDILRVAKEHDVDAIHPGYGFLSENSNLARRCAEEGLIFIGPRLEHLVMFGDKINARKQAELAGIPMIPGSKGTVNSLDEVLAFGEKCGYPIIIKAVNGGGGRGMRRCDTVEEVGTNFDLVKAEAKKAFGNDDIFMEKFLVEPKHIEVQVLGDEEGNVVHLFERDCSLQRRYQKVVELSPAFSVDKKIRQALYEDAVKIAKHVGYVNAGTVEFLMDRDKNFYFMEMNTRLQVEHPISELVTGKDIVKWQIRIAAGVELDCTQADIKVRGAAIECRINAGGVGKVNFLHIPSGPWVRFDTFLYQGYEVPPFYDSMLGKMIVFSSTREEAIRKMQSALCELVIGGLPNNIEDQIDIIRDPVFHSGDYYTDFIKNREG